MLKYKDFETLNYMRDIVKSWTEKANSPAIIDNTEFSYRPSVRGDCQSSHRRDGGQRNPTRRRGGLHRFRHLGQDSRPGGDVLQRPHLISAGSLRIGPITATHAERVGAKLLFVDRATRHMAEEVMTDEYSCPIVEEESFTGLTAEINPEELLVHADRKQAGDWNTLRYTSGSTGTPKGMLLTHRSTELMTYNYINRIGGVGLEGRFLCTMPLSSLEGCGMAQMFATSGLVPCIYHGRAPLRASCRKLRCSCQLRPLEVVSASGR